LLLLTPGIPEYLSGSSSFIPLVSNPLGFFLGLAFDLALYGCGVLLIREASIRWRKGWATILTLGIAYAILEEGIAVDTFFYARASPVGVLGGYGHWLGVNWVWATELGMFHALVSIALPIFLLGLALPETRGRSLLTGRELKLTVGILGLDVVLMDALVARAYGFWPGVPLTLAGLAIMVGLVVVAFLLPPGSLPPQSGPPKGSKWVCWVMGALLLPGSILIEQGFASTRVPAALAVLALIVLYAVVLTVTRWAAGGSQFVRPRLAFVLGTISPVMLIGVVSEGAFPVLLVADAVAIAFFAFLWVKYPDPGGQAPALRPTIPA
jgi:hypothetical protein